MLTELLLPRRFERRIYLGLFLLLCAFVPVLAASFLSLRGVLRQEKSFVELRTRQIELVGRLNNEFEKQLSLMPVFVLTGQRELLDGLENEKSAMRQTLRELGDLATSDEERKILRSISDSEAEHSALGREGIRLREAGSVKLANDYFRRNAGAATDNIRQQLDTYSSRKDAELDEAEAALAVSARNTQIGLIAASAITLLFFGLVSFLMISELRRKRRADLAFARAAERERELSRMRKETVDVVSHDLKNPIAALKLRIQMLARRGSQDAGLERDMRLALQSVNSMDALVRDLLDHAKIESGTFTLAKRRCQAPELVEAALARLAPLALQKQVRLDSYLEPGFPELSCDPDRVAQVLDNLIGNALKFTPPGGHVRVSAAHQARQVMFSVSDTGPGIAPENLARVFERFWQAGETSAQGHGLGLAIAKGVVESHGGRIWAESRPGHGAEFFFSLPLDTVAAASVAHPSPRAGFLPLAGGDPAHRRLP